MKGRTRWVETGAVGEIESKGEERSHGEDAGRVKMYELAEAKKTKGRDTASVGECEGGQMEPRLNKNRSRMRRSAAVRKYPSAP